MGLLGNRNKPSMSGSMSGRAAKGLTGRGRPDLCQNCLDAPARVKGHINGKPVRLCHDCADEHK